MLVSSILIIAFAVDNVNVVFAKKHSARGSDSGGGGGNSGGTNNKSKQ